MARPNPKNERIKRRYAQHLKEARQLGEASVDKALAAIDRYEAFAKKRDFAAFTIDRAVAFKEALAAETNPKTGKPLAKGTVASVLKALRAFHIWLADQPGFRARIRYSDADYFNPSNRDIKLALAADERPSPSPEQIRQALSLMPAETAIQMRDRALVAFLFTTGMRDGAAIGLKLRHLDLEGRTVRQDPREIRTKFSKSMTTDFFPVGDDVETIVRDYVRYLREVELWSPDDPLFPKTQMEATPDRGFQPAGLQRAHWATAASVRQIVKSAFTAAGMPPYGPHSFRKTLARLGMQICGSAEEFKAWSQNMSHEEVLTTFRAYGQVQAEQQRALLAGMREQVETIDVRG